VTLAAINYTAIWAAAVTGLTALAVALIGLFSSRLTASVAKLQVQAETERLHAQHAEQHLQHRQGVYHDVLNADRRLLELLRDPNTEQEAVWKAWRLLTEAVNGAVLFGTSQVGSSAVDFANQVRSVMLKADESADQSWRNSRRTLTNAMRADVAVDQTALRTPRAE
jgi:hypothetical protein